MNVKTWNTNSVLNAKGDGITDDAPAVQQALNSLTNGGTLYFPVGTYKLGTTVNTSDGSYALELTVPNITILGDGPGSVLLQTNCATTLLYSHFSTGAAGLIIENIKFQGDTNGTYTPPGDWMLGFGPLVYCSGIGRQAGYSKGLTIRNVTTDDQGKRNTLLIGGMDDILIENNRFIHYATTSPNEGSGYDTIVIPAEGIGRLRLLNNYADGDANGSTNISHGELTLI